MAPCLDGLALAHLDCIDGASQADFGKERMYGAVFWGVGSLCAGVGIDRFGFGFLYVMTVLTAVVSYVAIGVYLVGLRRDTTGAFVVSAVVVPPSSSSLLVTVGEEEWNGIGYLGAEQQRNPTPSSRNTSSSNPTEGENNKTSAMQLFSLICQTGYGKALLFFVFALAVGISIVDNLAFIFFDTLGSSNTMNGLTVVFTVIFEVPIFYLAPRFLQKHGPGKLLLAAGIAYIVRVLGYTVAPHMSVVLLLETLHGVSYAGGKAGSVEYIAQIAPKGYEATGQGLLIFVNYMGIVAGLFAGGHIQETLGSLAMFYVMATIVALGTVVLLIAEICLGAPKRENEGGSSYNNPDEESTNLIKSESACSSGSYGDRATESFMRKNLKYDSLNKYVKDW
uniref:Major facilitator superfamily associated domain-containing protein n=1 Tax=Skeletonema marinoi TaxID=267567 RepID=A0A7S2PIT9_9STRA